MALSTLYSGKYGTILCQGHAGFLVSTVVSRLVAPISLLYKTGYKPFHLKSWVPLSPPLYWVLPPLSNSWIIMIIWVYIASAKVSSSCLSEQVAQAPTHQECLPSHALPGRRIFAYGPHALTLLSSPVLLVTFMAPWELSSCTLLIAWRVTNNALSDNHSRP